MSAGLKPLHPELPALNTAILTSLRILQSTLTTIQQHPPPPNAPPRGVAAQYAHCANAGEHAAMAGSAIQSSLIALSDSSLDLRAVTSKLATAPLDAESGIDLNVPIPVDLLDLMDHGNINPELYGQELLRRTLALRRGVRRRKTVMDQVRDGIREGIREREEKIKQEESSEENGAQANRPPLTLSLKAAKKKRKRGGDEDDEDAGNQSAKRSR
jgi:hypothetical protein